MDKYRLDASDTKTVDGVLLTRVIRNSDDELGGYIESVANLAQSGSCFLTSRSMIYGNAVVTDDAQIDGIVKDAANISGSAQISGMVFEQAQVSGSATIGGRVYGSAQIRDSGRVFGEAFDEAVVEDFATVYGRIHGQAVASGHDVVYGDRS